MHNHMPINNFYEESEIIFLLYETLRRSITLLTKKYFKPKFHQNKRKFLTICCKKRFSRFPFPDGMSLTKLSLVGNNLLSPIPRKVW